MANLGKLTALRQEMVGLRKAFTEKLAKFKLTQEENKKLKSDLEKSEMMCSGLKKTSEMMCSGLKTGVLVLEEQIKEKDLLISQLQSEVKKFEDRAKLLKEAIMALPDGEDE